MERTFAGQLGNNGTPSARNSPESRDGTSGNPAPQDGGDGGMDWEPTEEQAQQIAQWEAAAAEPLPEDGRVDAVSCATDRIYLGSRSCQDRS